MAENEQVQQQFSVQRLFVKDLSFESPMGAQVFTKSWKPSVNVDLNTSSSKLDDSNFEVVLTVTITGKLDDEVAFLVEVQQAGIFLVAGIEGDDLRRALGIIAPNLLFPYVREAIDSLAVRGGFPPINLSPVNFDALYAKAAEQAAAQQAGQPAADPH